ncbi:WcaG Nucleoside-diphosphate-sugar epimerases [Burkholderiaceae bacterium]
MTPRVLVTGGQGFIGKTVSARLLEQGLDVRVSTRKKLTCTDPHIECIHTNDLSSTTNWLPALQAIDAVIHCAALVSVMRGSEADLLSAFRAVNVEGTLNLARQAVAAGVRRFVFVSSIKVNGESTKLGQPFTIDDITAPEDAYGLTKLEAEQGLLALAEQTGMEVVILRPPLVYGPNVKGNFASIMQAVKKGIPLPFGAVNDNLRSMVSVDNLVSLMITCLTHPNAANQVFMVRDGEDLSTAGLLRRLGVGLGTPARLVPVPQILLRYAASALGQGDLARRLLGNLQVDDRKTRELLNWAPVQGVDDGINSACSTIFTEK